MASLRFTAEVKILGVNPYVLVTPELVQKLKKDWRKPMPVLVRVNGKPDEPWRINMMPRGDGSFYLYLHGDVRKASGTKVGDIVELDVGFDPDYRNGPLHPMPEWFENPLNKSIAAKKSWNALPPSRQKEILRYLVGLKSDEARQRNVARALDALSKEDVRFMGRTWNNGK